LGACGPIGYVGQVSSRAASDVAGARSVRADKYAPYWFALAVAYLDKAREEAAQADFQAANRLGRRATAAAARATAEALAAARRGGPPQTPAAAPSGGRRMERR